MSAEESQDNKPNSVTKSKIPKLRRCSSLRSKGEQSGPRLYSVNSGEIHHQDSPAMDVATPLTNQFNRFRSQQNKRMRYRSSSLAKTSPEVGMRKLSLPVKASAPQSPTYSDDGDTMSVCSTMSCGPTMMGAAQVRDKRCVVHCSRHHEEPEAYLTPTQRANREIKNLKFLLKGARREVSNKEIEISRLRQEVVELKLGLGDKDSFDGDSKSPTDESPKRTPPEELRKAFTLPLKLKVPTIEKFKSETDLCLIGKDGVKKTKHRSSLHNGRPTSINGSAKSPQSLIDIPHSLADSGHFDDLVSSCMGSKESLHVRRMDACERCSREEKKMQEVCDRKVDEVRRNSAAEYQELKEKCNDKVEKMLQKLEDANSSIMSQRKENEELAEKNKQLQMRIENVQQEQAEQDIKHHQMYLHMYRKGQDAAKFESEEQHPTSSNTKVTDLIEQLQITENELERIKALLPQASLLSTDEAFFLWISALRKGNDKQEESTKAVGGGEAMSEAEVTLQFLKSAVYYFLTDRDNHKGHLRAIQSILGYSELEKINIDRATRGGKFF